MATISAPIVPRRSQPLEEIAPFFAFAKRARKAEVRRANRGHTLVKALPELTVNLCKLQQKLGPPLLKGRHSFPSLFRHDQERQWRSRWRQRCRT